jgi:hypothetical protein
MNLRHIWICWWLSFVCGGSLAWGQNSLPALTEKQDRVLRGIARDRFGGRWVDLTPAQLGELRKRAEAYLEQQRKWHLPWGQVASVRFADTNRSQISSYEALDLGATQTGYLLGALAIRFNVLRDARSQLEISNVLNGVELLLRSGPKPGYLPSFVGPADNAAYQAFYTKYGGPDPQRPGFGRLAFASKDTNGTPLVWLAGGERDQYSALNFGLSLVRKGARDPALRERAERATLKILDRVTADGWRLEDGQGRTTFITQELKTALLFAGATVDSKKYLDAYKTNAAALLEQPAPSLIRFGNYAANLAHFANFYLLSRSDPDDGRRLQFQRILTQMWQTGEVDLNPFYAAFYEDAFLIEEPPNSSGALSILQGILYSYPPPPRRSLPPVPDPTMVRLTANGREWSRHALLLPERPVAPFQWMQSPHRFDGPTDPLVEHPGVDYMLTFWMGRDSGLIQPEDALPASALGRRRGNTNSGVTNLPTAPIVAPKLTP